MAVKIKTTLKGTGSKHRKLYQKLGKEYGDAQLMEDIWNQR